MENIQIKPPDDDGSDDYEVEPPDIECDQYSTREVDEELLPKNINDEWERNYAEQTQWDYQFSLAELMAVIAFAAVVLTAVRLFPGSLGVTAFVLGVATGLGALVLRAGTGFGGLFHLCWWTLLALYLIVSLAAVFLD